MFECDLQVNFPKTEDSCKNTETISYYADRAWDSVNITEGQINGKM